MLPKQTKAFQNGLKVSKCSSTSLVKNFQMPLKHSRTFNMFFKLSKNLPSVPQVVETKI